MTSSTAPSSGPSSAERAHEYPYRMKDLSDRTGLPRQVIHFYIQQGLVPEGKKTGRNMAYYGEHHLERIKLVRQLQHERFLPLKAIRAIVADGGEPFSPEQRAILLEVKNRLTPMVGAAGEGRVGAAEVALRYGVTQEDLEELVETGLLAGTIEGKGKKKKLSIEEDDLWLVEIWKKLREIGFSRALGFTPRDMGVYEEALSKLFAAETQLLTERMSQLAPERIATMVERAVPLLNTFLVRYHERKIRAFFAALGG